MGVKEHVYNASPREYNCSVSYTTAALYSDDLAHDVRSIFRDLIAEGKTPQEATESLVAEFAGLFKEFPDDEAVFWLALAAAQWRSGRLLDKVKKRAIDIIDSGGDLQRFSPRLRSSRTKVLTRLRETLTSRQPAQRTIRKRRIHLTQLEVGDLIQYTLLSGNLVVFRVVGHSGDASGRYAICELLDWIGSALPDDQVLLNLPAKEAVKPFVSRFQLPEPGPRTRGRERLRPLGLRAENAEKPIMPHWSNYWQNFDSSLSFTFGLT